MRPTLSVLALMLGASVLSACGKTPSASDQAAAPVEPASAPTEPTPAQQQAILATMPSPYNAADLVNGKQVFAQCAACHTLTKGGPNMTGPNLYGVFGRKAGSVADFNYSDGLKAYGVVWDAQHIDTWITNPRAVVAATRMSFAGLKDAKDRTDVVAYLKVQTTPPAP
jgi:cytochrome c